MVRLAILFVVLLASVLATPTNPQANEPSKFTQLLSQIKELLPDPNQVIKTLNQHVETQIDNFQSISTKLNEQVQTIDLSKYVDQVTSKLGEIKASLEESVGTNVTAKAAELKAQLRNSIQTVSTEFNTFIANAKPNLDNAGQSVQGLAKEAYEKYLNAVNGIKSQINDYLQQAETSAPK